MSDDEQVFNGALVALKPPRVTLPGGVSANGNPADQEYAEGVIVGCSIVVGVNDSLGCDVKIQVGIQLVPDAGVRAAHPRLHPGKRLLIPHRRRPRRAAPVAVQIVTQPGQLQQTGNVNQVVIIPVVVHLGRNRRQLRRNARPRVELQYRIIRTRPKVPRVIRPIGEDIVPVGVVHINVPGGVNARVPGGAGQVAGGFPLRHIGVGVVRNGTGGNVPVTGGYRVTSRGAANIPDQPAHVGVGSRTARRPGGIAGGYGIDGAGAPGDDFGRPNQPAHPGIGPVGGYRPRGVRGDYRAGEVARARQRAHQAARCVRVGGS